MKNIPYLFFIIIPLSSFPQKQGDRSQNLIQNPSFENYTACPTGFDQVSNAVGWSSYRETPDYLNSCGSGMVSTPSNIMGYQIPRTGNAYCGIITFAKAGFYREAIGCQLTTPLIIGQKYFVSFYVSLAINPPNFAYASNKIGIKFTTTSYSAYSNQIPVNNIAQLHYDSVITDTTNWKLISGLFTADSAYQYIAIGNFFDALNTDTICIKNVQNKQWAYYYVDDIYISIDSTGKVVNTNTQPKEDTLIVPNLVTPNADNLNDEFKIKHIGEFENFSVKIFNRWGAKIFESQNINFTWDARTNTGYIIPDGTYYYIITANGKDSKEWELHGAVTVIR